MSHANLSRRAILAGAASLPALAGPVVIATAPASATPTADDTIARIARHRDCAAESEAICHRGSELSEAIPLERRKHYGIWHRGTDVGKDDDSRWTTFEGEYWAASDEMDAIAWSFVERPPSSVAGVAALLAYAAEHEEQGYEWPDRRHNFSESGRYVGSTEEDWRSSMMAAVASALAKIGAQS
jgi:hypothetical protein